MPFSDEVVRKAWSRAGGKCECRRKTHGHRYTRCGKQLVWGNRGRSGRGAWEAHHKSASGGDGLSNVEILCWDCHRKTVIRTRDEIEIKQIRFALDKSEDEEEGTDNVNPG